MGTLFEVEGSSGNVETPLVQGITGNLVLQPLPSSGDSVVIKDDTGTSVITVQSGAATISSLSLSGTPTFPGLDITTSGTNAFITYNDGSNSVDVGIRSSDNAFVMGPVIERFFVWNGGITMATEVTTGPLTADSVTLTATENLVFTDNTTNTVSIAAHNGTTSYSLKLPTVQGASSTVLTNDGSGNLSWASGGGGVDGYQVVTVVNGSITPSGAWNDLTSLVLPAGEWLISYFLTANSNQVAITELAFGISPNPGNDGTGMIVNAFPLVYVPDASTNAIIPFSSAPVKVSGGTTYYLKSQAVYSAGNPESSACLVAFQVNP